MNPQEQIDRILLAEKKRRDETMARIRATLPKEPYTPEQMNAGPTPKTEAEKRFVRKMGYLPTWRSVENDPFYL